jgi:Ca2+-binding RTX toxin-like protein
MMGQTMLVKRTILLLSVMMATLIAASGVALAVSKVCPSGSTQSNPCSGTTAIDTLLGTSGVDYIKGLAGNDKISGGAGNDTTDGGGGNDTYSYKEGWGQDTVIDSGGTDALNFSAVQSAGGVHAQLSFTNSNSASNYVNGPNGEYVSFPSGTILEKVTGTSGFDDIRTAEATNTLRPGPGTGGAFLTDFGGCPSNYCATARPVSSDTYSGFAASGYGTVIIEDWGGTLDKLILPFASTDVYFEAYNQDNDQAAEGLLLLTSDTDTVNIDGQLEPTFLGDGVQQKGHIEQIQFTDETITIGSETAAQTLSGSKTTGSAEAQVEKLNDAAKLDAAEKQKRKEAAKKIKAEAEKKAQDLDEKLPASGAEDKR